jgi:DNA polymerase III alpha subunit
MNYTCYHKHSYYSNVITPDSPVSPQDYAFRAMELDQKAISSVEHGYQGRVIEYYELAKKNGLKFIFGTEAYWVKNRFDKDKTNNHIILLAKTERGRQAINSVLSEANLTGFYYKQRLDIDLILSLPKDHIWATSACVGGWKYDDSNDIWLKIAEHFGKNFFFEVQNHNTESQISLNKRIIELSNQYNIPIIYGSDSHFIYPEQSKERDNYLLSKSIVYDDEKDWYLDYPSVEVSIQRFENQGVLTQVQIKEAINNTNILLEVENYNAKVFNLGSKLPSIYPDKTQSEKDKIFSDLVWCEWDNEKNNIPKEKWEFYEEEIQKELDVIISTKITDYFLLDYEVVKKGKELGGHITLTGRGSSPSFIISKLLGFTTIDRIAATVKLFPERFITKERILEAEVLPDVDFNLGNPEIFAQAQIDVMGNDHSYPMLAYGTLKPKAAWKLYARAKNIDFETANLISSQIDEYDMELKHVDESEKEDVDILEFIDKNYRNLYSESTEYLGIVSDWKIHPCGYLLYSGNIKEEIGLVRIKDHICTVMDGLWAEEYKFLKNDLLKVNVVELIHRVYDRIKVQPHTLPELLKLCENNDKVWDVYKNAFVFGVNQVEQTSTKGRVAKYAPKNISELSAFIGSIRPGFKSNYKQFESREPFSYGIPSLDKIIQTKEFPQSYMIFQENSMQVMAYAGIPIAQTYEIVKNIAKKRSEKVFKYKEQFLTGMTEKIKEEENTTLEEAEKIAQMTWQIIEDSSHYQFNASHAYSVAGDSLYGAYLKSHYPLQFYETFLQLLEENGEKDRLAEAKVEAEKAYHIQFPPYRFGQDNRYIKADLEKNAITSSLSSIKSFSQSIGENLFELSKYEYETFLDFLVRAEESGCLSSKFEQLIRINYFEKFGNNKKLLVFYQEFDKGKNRYSKKLTDKSKQKRLVELKILWDNLPNERLSFMDQIISEQDILGYVQATFPVNKKYIYVASLDTRYAPRIQAYCLATGKTASLKIYKKTYENKPFLGGDILYCRTFEKKNATKFVEGRFVEDNTEEVWWITDYSPCKIEDFNDFVKEKV